MSKKVSKLNDAIKAISLGTEDSLKKTKTIKKTKKEIPVEEEEIKVDESKFETSFDVGKRKGDINYKKLELHSQILLRPDTYIGSCKLMSEPVYVKVDNIIKEKEIKYPEGLIRIFIEVLSNAIDNTWRSLQEGITPKFIKVSITDEGKVSIWNDGKNIPLEMHPEEKVYIPEMIFGQLLTSSNYNDEEERKTSGRNGYGVKLSSIFSKEFNIEIYNKDAGKIYRQEWKDNMYKKSEPVIKSKGFPKTVEDGKNGYTMVEFIPDFKRFNIEKFTPDILSLYEKLVYDTAMTVSLKGVKVMFNNELIKVNNLKDYVNLYFSEPQKDMLLLSSKDCRVVLCPSNDFTQVSFVNGIYTKDGGIHVKKWTETVFKPIAEKINDGLKGKGHIDISHIKKHFFIFIYADLVNPSFKNQNKTFLDGPQVEAEIKDNEIKKLMKWGFVEKIKDSLKTKELNTLKSETERKRGIVDVDGLKDANFAGKKGKNADCVLCIAEGSPVNIGQLSVPIEQLEYIKNISTIECFSYDETLNGCIYNKITNFFNQGEKECIQITFEDGRQIVCTPDHKILLENGIWEEAQNIINKNIKFSIETPIKNISLDKKWKKTLGSITLELNTYENYFKSCAYMRLLAYTMTDGNLRYSYKDTLRAVIYVGHKLDSLEVIKDVYLLTGKIPSEQYSKGVFTIELPNELAQSIKELKNEIAIGKRVEQESYLPKFLFDEDCPLIIISEFLGGLYGADGHAPCLDVSSNNDNITPINFSQSKDHNNLENLSLYLKGIQELLLKFGIDSVLGKPRLNSTCKLSKTSRKIYEQCLRIPNNYSIIFHENIGYKYCYHKTIRLCLFMSWYKMKKTIINQMLNRIDNIKNMLSDNKIGIEEAVSRHNISFNRGNDIKYEFTKDIKLGIIYQNRNNEQYTPVMRTNNFISFSEYLKRIGGYNCFIKTEENKRKVAYSLDKDANSVLTFKTKVIDIRPVGIRKVYDIEVDKTHNFQVNGILVHNCVTEGDSANTYAVAGMKYGLKFNGKEVKGRDYIGSLPIRGKFLNVRNASIQSLLKNSEVKSLIQALGLQYDVDYSVDENYKKLRYGRLMALTDADNDGYHITGLLFNFIHSLFPSLAKRKGFFNLMRIPIVKIAGKHNKSFFTQYAAEEYIKKNNPKKDDIKYFKGLGTAQDEDIEEDFGRRLVEFEVDDGGDKMMDNIFGKENADFRKEWIMNYEQKPSKEGKDYTVEDLTITEFLNNEMILFSIDDCKRSIPSMIDGLKESQRKILFSAFKRKLNYNDKSIKVAQFSGYVAEHSGYHHGEQNLVDTTIKMAQTFVGSNNIPLFFNEGQFGSRTMNGADAASGRYLFTKLNMTTRSLFRTEDDDFLKDRVEEGETVEKDFYVPVVPTILVNGCSAGIGSGFSSSIPSYKLEDIINQINRWLDKQEFEEIVPWYRGFKGVIKVDGKKVITEGVYEHVKENTYRVTELPIGKSNISIDKYEAFLKELHKEKKIVSFSSNCTENNVEFTINVGEEFEVSHKTLNLLDAVHTSNMVMFDPENKIKKYDTVKDILEEFCSVRYSLYEVRKEGIIKDMEEELKYLKNKINFITEIVNNTISLKERDDESLNKELTTKKYDMKEGSFDYLLNIQVRSMTSKRIKELKDKETDLKHHLNRYRIKTIKDIWTGELHELVEEYNKWLSFENGRKVSSKDKRAKKVVKK